MVYTYGCIHVYIYIYIIQYTMVYINKVVCLEYYMVDSIQCMVYTIYIKPRNIPSVYTMQYVTVYTICKPRHYVFSA
jgi:hypothetical protein